MLFAAVFLCLQSEEKFSNLFRQQNNYMLWQTVMTISP